MLSVASLTTKLPFGNKSKATGFRMMIQAKLNAWGIPVFGRYLFILGLIVGLLCVGLGILVIIPKFSYGRWYMGIYTSSAGVFLTLFEFPFPFWRQTPIISFMWTDYLFRSIMYIGLSIPCFFSKIGIAAGGIIVILAILYALCWLRGESAEKPADDVLKYEQLTASITGGGGSLFDSDEE